MQNGFQTFKMNSYTHFSDYNCSSVMNLLFLESLEFFKIVADIVFLSKIFNSSISYQSTSILFQESLSLVYKSHFLYFGPKGRIITLNYR